MKTIKQMLLTVAALMCSVAVHAYDFEVDGMYYKIISLSELTVEVTYGDNKYEGEVVIPSTVTYKSKTLNVTGIGSSAFEDCSSLSSITIGNSVTTIGESAFRGCSSLSSITIPNSVTGIGASAFLSCSSLSSVTIGNSVTTIGMSAFSGCRSLSSITIPNSVTTIGAFAFDYCRSLSSVTIGNSVTTIGGWAFRDCRSLSSITIPNSVTSIGYNAFSDCDSLKNLCIENGEKSLSLGDGEGDPLFNDCPLETLYLGRTLEWEGGSSIFSSEDDFFREQKKLKSVTIGNCVTKITNNAFKDCDSLKNLCIEDGKETLYLGYNYNDYYEYEYGLFRDCPLETIYLGRNLSYSSYSPFEKRKSLKSVTIGNSVTRIVNSVFEDCSNLSTIYLMGSVPPSIGDGNFMNADYVNDVIYVPQGTLATYQTAEGWKNFWDIREYDATGIEDLDIHDIEIKVTENGISLSGAEGKAVGVYGINGSLVWHTDAYTGEEIFLGNGIYVLRVGGKSLKVKI